MGDYSFDLSGRLEAQSTGRVAQHSTNRKAGYDLDMDGFLQLMVATLQNQTMDDTADASEMMNQMVQMSVIQAISNISTLVSDSTNLTYAVSLVGKEVTIGQYINGEIKEFVGTVTGTGTLNGRQVIFLDDDETPYYLTDILAVGRLPDIKGDGSTGKGDDTAGSTTPSEGVGDGNGDGNGNGEIEGEEEEEEETADINAVIQEQSRAIREANRRDPHVPDELGALG